jgi:prephenate dehydrogenase
VVLTPTGLTDRLALERVSEFWQALGSHVITLDPEVHDRVVAAVSHLPHLVAFALVDAASRMDTDALSVAGRGFADTTRIAASDPQVWREIFLANREALAESLAAFRAAVDRIEQLINAQEAVGLEALLARIRAVRHVLG